MKRNRIEEEDIRRVSEELGLPEYEVRKAVRSFFSVIASYASKLPYDDERRIYSKEGFEELIRVWSIPYIGRMGPVYSRYIQWRANEARYIEQKPRSNYRSRITQSELETMAEDILSGKPPRLPEKKRWSEFYKRVWLVGKDGKRSARQVIPKIKE